MTVGAPGTWEEPVVCVCISMGRIHTIIRIPAQGVNVRGLNGSTGTQGQSQADWSLG